jgi:chromosome segregation ATPase
MENQPDPGLETAQNIEQLKVGLNSLTDQLQNLSRQVRTLQESVDLVFEDRQILEDIKARIVALEEKVLLSRQHQDTVTKSIKADILGVKSTVTEKVKEVQDSVGEHIGVVADEIAKKDGVVYVKEGFLKRITRFLSKKGRG